MSKPLLACTSSMPLLPVFTRDYHFHRHIRRGTWILAVGFGLCCCLITLSQFNRCTFDSHVMATRVIIPGRVEHVPTYSQLKCSKTHRQSGEYSTIQRHKGLALRVPPWRLQVVRAPSHEPGTLHSNPRPRALGSTACLKDLAFPENWSCFNDFCTEGHPGFGGILTYLCSNIDGLEQGHFPGFRA